MPREIKTKTVIAGFSWRFAERILAQGVSFIVSVVLARLLMPETYGIIALVTVFTNIIQTFVDSGFGNALIQKKDADDLDFSSVFYFNIVLCISLYTLLFFCAPLIARFYSMPELVPVVRVLGIKILISGVKNIQQAYVSRNMLFKRFFFATLGGTIGAAIIGITMAYLGFGVWALVVQNLFNATVDTIILWITVKWRPKKQFSFERLKTLFGFGWKLLVSSLIDKVYNDIRQLIIGKLYSPSELAYYNRGKQIPHLFITNINTSIDSVLLPAMANEQDDKNRVRAMTRRAIKTSVYLLAPIMIGVAVVAEPLIDLLLTEKWLFAVPFMRIFCITYMFYPIHTANLNAIKAMGRSDLFLKLEIIKKVVGMIVLLITMRISVMAMAYSLLFTSVCAQIINSWPNRKLLGYSYLDQMKDIMPAILLSVMMGMAIYCFIFLHLNDYITITLQVITGVTIYVIGSKILKIEEFKYIYDLIQNVIKKKRC